MNSNMQRSISSDVQPGLYIELKEYDWYIDLEDSVDMVDIFY
jgi:hypothetical protein